MKHALYLIAALLLLPVWVLREIWLSNKMRSVERRSWR